MLGTINHTYHWRIMLRIMVAIRKEHEEDKKLRKEIISMIARNFLSLNLELGDQSLVVFSVVGCCRILF